MEKLKELISNLCTSLPYPIDKVSHCCDERRMIRVSHYAATHNLPIPEEAFVDYLPKAPWGACLNPDEINEYAHSLYTQAEDMKRVIELLKKEGLTI